MKINFQRAVGNFNYELLRTLSYQATGGAELSECLATVGRIEEGSFESWVKEWMSTAERVLRYAEASLRSGDLISARHAFLRASNYYRSAEFYAPPGDPYRMILWQHSRDCFQRAGALFHPPIEPVCIPFEDTILPGYFVRGGEGSRPTLIAITGFDGSAEELYHLIGASAVQRGCHCLMFEGPGQRGAIYLNPDLVMRPDFEAPVHAVIDYVVARPEVDPGRLAVIGYSMGGYLAVRAAAFEPRIRACIANPLAVDLGTVWESRIPGFISSSPRMVDLLFAFLGRAKPEIRWGVEHARWAMGIHKPHEFFGECGWKRYHLWDTPDHLRIPLLVLAGEDEFTDSQSSLLDLLHFLETLKCEVTFRLFTREEGGAMHCQMGALSQAQAAIFEWLAKTFSTEDADAKARPRITVPESLVRLVQKRFGNELADQFARLGSIWP